MILDSATIPPGVGVNTTVQSITTSYDDIGRVQIVTSYSATRGTGTVLNQVQDSYDGSGNLAEEWQNPDGTVSPSVAPRYNTPTRTVAAAAWPPICG